MNSGIRCRATRISARLMAAGSRVKSGNAPVGRVARGGVVGFFVYATGVGLTYFSQLVIARVVDVNAYGVYAFVSAWVLVLAYLSALGFDVAVLRFVPTYEAEQAWHLLRGVVRYAQTRATAVGLFIVFVGVSVVATLVPSTEVRNTFFVGFLLVPVLAVVRIQCAVLRAYGRVIAALGPDRVVRDGMLIVLLGIGSFALGWNINAPSVMLANLVSASIGVVCAAIVMRSRGPRAARVSTPAYDGVTWRRAALPLVILAATEALMNRTGVILLGWMTNTRDAGIFSLAFNIAFVVAMPRTALNTLFAPTIASLFARGEKATMQVLVARTASWMACAGLCIAVLVFVLADPLLGWFGPGYEAGAPVVRVLLVGQIISVSAGSQLYVMTMTGQERRAAVLLLACAIGNAAVTAVLINALGLIGSAIATATSLIVMNATLGASLWRSLGLAPGVVGLVGGARQRSRELLGSSVHPD